MIGLLPPLKKKQVAAFRIDNGNLKKNIERPTLFRGEFQGASSVWDKYRVKYSYRYYSIISLSSLTLLAVSATYMLFHLSYTKRVTASGEVTSSDEVISISSTQQGVINNIYVKEGDRVRKGQVIAEIDADTSYSEGNLKAKQARHIEDEINLLKEEKSLRKDIAGRDTNNLASQITLSTSILSQQDSFCSAYKSMIVEITGRINRVRLLIKNNLDTNKHLDDLTQQYASLYSEMVSAQNAKNETIDKLLELSKQKSTSLLQMDIDIKELDQKIDELTNELSGMKAQRRFFINSPTDGKITSIESVPGEILSQNAPLMKIVPNDGQPYIDLYVDSTGIALIRKDQRVWMKYASFPYETYGTYAGIVIDVTSAPVSLQSAGKYATRADYTGAKDVPYFRVKVKPDEAKVSLGDARYTLTAGMAVTAEIATDRRKLYQWVLSPLWDLKVATANISRVDDR